MGGYIAAFSETRALAVVVSKGIPPLKDAVINEPEDHIKAASAWSLGQIGRHSPDYARALAEADVLRRLLAVYLHQDSSEDLQTKAKRALKSVIQKCTHLPALEPLLRPERRLAEDPGGEGRGRIQAPRLHRRDQHALSARDRTVLFAELCGNSTQEDGRIQPVLSTNCVGSVSSVQRLFICVKLIIAYI